MRAPLFLLNQRLVNFDFTESGVLLPRYARVTSLRFTDYVADWQKVSTDVLMSDNGIAT